MSLDAVDRWLMRDGGFANWELFHENSKVGRHDRHPTLPLDASDETISRLMRQVSGLKEFPDRRRVPLSVAHAPNLNSGSRRNIPYVGAFTEAWLDLQALAAVLLSAADAGGGNAPGMPELPCPLEWYVCASRVTGLSPGLYHLDPPAEMLECLSATSPLDALPDSLRPTSLARAAAAIVFVAAVFCRTTIALGDRGYRLALVEAGRSVQRGWTAATAAGIGYAGVGRYYDREVDRWLGLDGLTESVIEVFLLGTSAPGSDAPGQANRSG
jgi:SagB-type dehydrogenase family enzyme